MPNYRQNAAILITDGQGRVLLCEREDIPGAVQTVQGGIDPGETPEEAARRELWEEIGLKYGEYELIGSLPRSLVYEWPAELKERWQSRPDLAGFDGQEQYFFLVRVAPDTAFDLTTHHREFSRVWWGTPDELVGRAWDYKRANLRAALEGFGLIS